MGKKIVVIGGVACGPKAAARARRRDPEAEITIVERGPFVSYAGCGLPYFISGVVEGMDNLMSTSYGAVRDALFFDKVKNVKVLTKTEAVKIDRAGKKVLVKNLETGAESELPYDGLVIATGCAPVKPPIPGMELENVFTLRRPSEAKEIREKIEGGQADRICIIGAGRIGLEAAEAFANQAVETTIVDFMPQVLPGLIDEDMAAVVAHFLTTEKVSLFLGEKVKSFEREGGKVVRVVTDKRTIETDAVLVAVGVRPEVTLAKEAGLEIGVTGAILVNDRQETSDPDIYAGGDCAETMHLISMKKTWVPLGSIANRQGRVIGDNIVGGLSTFPGVVGTGILRTLGANIGATGLTETQARELGYDPVSCLAPSGDKSHFFPGGKNILIKLIADRNSGKLLGAQIVGPGDVVRRLDTVATALMFGANVDQVGNLDLAYAPPFGTAIEAVAHAANILRNKIAGLAPSAGPAELRRMIEEKKDMVIIDVRAESELKNIPKIDDPRAVNIPLEQLRSRVSEIPQGKPVVVVCQLGVRAYEAMRAIQGLGFTGSVFLDGGMNVFSRSG